MKSRFTIILYAAVCLFVLINTAKDWYNNVFIFDRSGYHLPLPALIIYDDIYQLEFYSYIDSVYQPSGPFWKNFCIHELDNGNRIDRYNIGVAVHELPFFLTAHFVNSLILHYPADGYSLPYQWGGVLSNLFWIILGLFALRKILLRYYSEAVTAITLLIITFGTNLYTHTTFSPCWAHTYAFFHFSIILLFTDSLYRFEKRKYFYLLGLMLGLVAITRTSNLLIGIIPLLWGISSIPEAKQRLQFYKKNLVHILFAALLLFAVAMIQLSYWKAITESWIYDGYKDEGFIWSEPMIFEGLLGFRKGWFIYTPVAIFTLLGLFSIYRSSAKKNLLAITVFILINIYVVFSWWNWWYGGSFSARALVESLAILAIPLAALIEWINRKKTPLKLSAALLFSLLIALNMFQSYQYFRHVILWDNMTQSYYFKTFLKTSVDEEEKKLLMTEKQVQEEYGRRQMLLNK